MAMCGTVLASRFCAPGAGLEDIKAVSPTPLSSALRLPSCRAIGGAGRFSSASSQIFGHFGQGKLKNLESSRRHIGRSVVAPRCEQASDGPSQSLNIWLGRAAMLGFVATIGVEITTGKGLLENAGILAPVPTVALALTAVVGAITAFGIFRSASQD